MDKIGLYPFIRTHGIKTNRQRTETPQVTGFDYGGDFISYYFHNFGRPSLIGCGLLLGAMGLGLLWLTSFTSTWGWFI
jgi:hypothetical protein